MLTVLFLLLIAIPVAMYFYFNNQLITMRKQIIALRNQNEKYKNKRKKAMKEDILKESNED